MKHLYTLLFLCIAIFSSGQCPTCTPDLSCVSVDGGPTLCPETLPAAMSGEYYEQVLTFYLPSSFQEPSLNVTVTLQQITISSVSGLPFGITYTTSSPNGVYFPNEGENYGCATLCGTPLIPGTYDVLISVAIIASVAGFEVTDNQSFTYTLQVDQGSVSTSSFTVEIPAACDQLTTGFNALIGGSSSQNTQYNWDFGNGTNSTEANPVVTFENPGEYTVSLNTVISNYVLNTVNLSNISDGGEGDVDDFFSAPADPYFTLVDGGGTTIFTSGTVDNSITASWSNLNIVLTSPPYTITFWDEDDITADDILGGFSINLSSGEIVFNSGDGTVGSWNISEVESANLTDETTVVVFASPIVSISAVANVLSVAQEVGSVYQWYLNGEMIADAVSPSLTVTEGGIYSCEVTNAFGCASLSDDFVYCEPVTPIYDAVANEIYVDNGFATYQWFFNGLPLDGANDFFIVDPATGNYGIQVTTDYGCTTNGAVITVVNAIGEIHWSGIDVFPNPFNAFITIRTQDNSMIEQVKINDITGKVVFEAKGNTSGIEASQLDLSELESGVYLIHVKSNSRIFSTRLLKK